MIEFAITMPIAIIAAFFLTVILLVYMRARAVSNAFLALAGQEFHTKATKLLQSSEELPDGVLSYIDFMNRSALGKYTAWHVYASLRKFNRGNGEMETEKAARYNEFMSQVMSMRKELISILGEMNAMWINWQINRNVVLGLLISLELKKIKASPEHIYESTEKIGASVFPRIDGAFC